MAFHLLLRIRTQRERTSEEEEEEVWYRICGVSEGSFVAFRKKKIAKAKKLFREKK